MVTFLFCAAVALMFLGFPYSALVMLLVGLGVYAKWISVHLTEDHAWFRVWGYGPAVFYGPSVPEQYLSEPFMIKHSKRVGNVRVAWLTRLYG